MAFYMRFKISISYFHVQVLDLNGELIVQKKGYDGESRHELLEIFISAIKITLPMSNERKEICEFYYLKITLLTTRLCITIYRVK